MSDPSSAPASLSTYLQRQPRRVAKQLARSWFDVRDALLPPVYIISYPKAGRTWLRSLLGKVMVDLSGAPEDRLLRTEVVSISAGYPRILFDHEQSEMDLNLRFDGMRGDKRRFRRNRVVILGRDVRDVLVSAYFQATKRQFVFEGSIGEFVRDERFGARKILMFYRQWYEERHRPKDLLFVRYEDLKVDAVGVLTQLLAFIDHVPADPGCIQRAVDFASFDNLKRAERENRFGTAILQAGNPTDPESFKVRKGAVGGFREYLSPADIEYVDTQVADIGCPFTAYAPPLQTPLTATLSSAG